MPERNIYTEALGKYPARNGAAIGLAYGTLVVGFMDLVLHVPNDAYTEGAIALGLVLTIVNDAIGTARELKKENKSKQTRE